MQPASALRSLCASVGYTYPEMVLVAVVEPIHALVT